MYDPPSVWGETLGTPKCHPAVPGRRLASVAPSCYVECGRDHGRCGGHRVVDAVVGDETQEVTKNQRYPEVNTCKGMLLGDIQFCMILRYPYAPCMEYLPTPTLGELFLGGRLTSHSLCNVLLV